MDVRIFTLELLKIDQDYKDQSFDEEVHLQLSIEPLLVYVRLEQEFLFHLLFWLSLF
jgi:hypothetical protein